MLERHPIYKRNKELKKVYIMKEDASKRFEKNQLVEVLIEDIGESGEGIGKADGYTLFIKDALVGDKIEALITKAKKNYGYARVNRIIEPSANRITPKCSDASRCGGCQIQALSYESQLQFKEKKVKDNIIRIGGFDKDFIEKITEPIVGAGIGEEYRYRNKAQFPIGTSKEGEIIAGFYAGRTHNIIPCKDCYIGVSENKEILNIILEYMRRNNITAYNETNCKGLVRHVLIRKGFTSGQIMVCLVLSYSGKVKQMEDGLEIIASLKNQEDLIDSLSVIPGMTSICVSINSENTNVIMGNEIHYLWGAKVINDTIHLRDVNNDFAVREGTGVTFEISPLSFYQVNPIQVEKLYSIAIEYADLKGDEEVWDLCCGIGTISLCIAKDMEIKNTVSSEENHSEKSQIHGIEIVPEAIEDAKKNASKNNIKNAEFICAPAEEYLPKHAKDIKADVIIMDPPRKGMEEEALKVVVETEPSRIVYVSCDPSTLARDLKYLCENGYELTKVRPVDMFMHSVHVETVCLLVK